MATNSPYRRCDLCGTSQYPSDQRPERRAWTLHHHSQVMTCPACRRKGEQLEHLAIAQALQVRRERQALHHQLAAEPTAPYAATPGFGTEYRRIKAKYPDALLLLRTGDWYVALQDDAERMAHLLGLALRTFPPLSFRCAEFPAHALETYLPQLVRAGLRVAIADRRTPEVPEPPVQEHLAGEPYGDAPLRRTHRIRLLGSTEELDVHRADGRFYALDGTWHLDVNDARVARVVRRYRLLGELAEQATDQAAEPSPAYGAAAREARYLRNARREVVERLEDILGVLRRHGAVPDLQGCTSDWERDRKRSEASDRFRERMEAIRAEMALRRVYVHTNGGLVVPLGECWARVNSEHLEDLLKRAKRVYSGRPFGGTVAVGAAPAWAVGNFTDADSAARTLACAEANAATAMQCADAAVRAHWAKHLEQVRALVADPHRYGEVERGMAA